MKRLVFAVGFAFVLALAAIVPLQIAPAQAGGNECDAILQDLYTFTTTKSKGDGTYQVVMYMVNNDGKNNYVGYSETPVSVSNTNFPSGVNTPIPQPSITVQSLSANQLLNARLWNFPSTTGGIVLPTYPFDPKSPDKLGITLTKSQVSIDTAPGTANSVKITFVPTCEQGLFHGLSQPYNAYYVISFKKVFKLTPNPK